MVQPLLIALPLSAWWGAGMELQVPKDCILLLLWALMTTWCLQWAPAPPVTLPADTRLQSWRSCLQTSFRRLCLRISPHTAHLCGQDAL